MAHLKITKQIFSKLSFGQDKFLPFIESVNLLSI